MPVSGSQTQSTLLGALRNGADALAWAEFSDRYWRLIFSFAKGHGCSDQTAEDVVQDVMLAVFKQREVFRYDPARGKIQDLAGDGGAEHGGPTATRAGRPNPRPRR